MPQQPAHTSHLPVQLRNPLRLGRLVQDTPQEWYCLSCGLRIYYVEGAWCGRRWVEVPRRKTEGPGSKGGWPWKEPPADKVAEKLLEEVPNEA